MLFALACTMSCGAKQAPVPSAPDDGEERPAPEDRVMDMHRHFDDINAIQQALVTGNLVSTRSLAKKVRIGFAGEAPEGWGPFVERTVASAEMMEVSDDLGMAARLAGTMAGTCGDCHATHGVRAVEHDGDAPPETGDSVSDFMIRHRWAADRMWEALVGPSDAAWRAGAEVLASSHLSAEDARARMQLSPETESYLPRLHQAAIAAPSTSGAAERQILYGNLLASCAGCHRRMLEQ